MPYHLATPAGWGFLIPQNYNRNQLSSKEARSPFALGVFQTGVFTSGFRIYRTGSCSPTPGDW